MVTIDDVARRAGVAPSTVSYAFSGKRSISPQTRQRIEQAVAELGFRPHAGARALASARTHTLGLMLPLRPAVDVHVVMEFVTGIVTRARAYDHDVLLITQDESDAVQRVGGGRMVDALILMDIEMADSRVAAAADLTQPTVLIGLPDDPQGLSCVDVDFDAAARTAVRHLASLGHRRIGLVGPSPAVLERHTSFADRLLRGFREQCDREGVAGEVELTEPTHPDVDRTLTRLLDGAPAATALVVHNEAALAAVLDGLRVRDLRVPADVSVLAICPDDVAQAQSVPLTFLDVPAETIGATAVDMAMARLDDRSTGVETRLISTRLVDRGSTRELDEGTLSP